MRPTDPREPECATAATSVRWGQESVFVGLLRGRIPAVRRQLLAAPGSWRGASAWMAASEPESGDAVELAALARRGSLLRFVFPKRSAGCGQVERALAVNCTRAAVLRLLTPPLVDRGTCEALGLALWCSR